MNIEASRGTLHLMRSLFVFLVLAAMGCTIQPAEHSGSCVSDTGAAGDSSSGTPDTTPKGCGETVKKCNCDATDKSPGDVEATSSCVSGAQSYSVCGQCPGGGYAWYTMCACQ
jgi:hypothetical protein